MKKVLDRDSLYFGNKIDKVMEDEVSKFIFHAHDLLKCASAAVFLPMPEPVFTEDLEKGREIDGIRLFGGGGGSYAHTILFALITYKPMQI